MPRPFPGMDPYLEDLALWPGIHQSLITYMRDALNPKIRPVYNARIGERVYLVEPQHNIYSDVTLLKRPQAKPQPVPAGGSGLEAPTATVALADPFVITIPAPEYREPFIEIVRNARGEVVAVIEILSPANKTGEGYQHYRQKQQEILNTQAHLVEIDLLSQGHHTIAVAEDALLDLPSGRYLICVSRAYDRPYRFEVYPLALKQRLPPFRIPLKAPDPDMAIDLQAIFDQSCDNGGYEDFVDYEAPPKVRLSADERAEALQAQAEINKMKDTAPA